MFVSTFRQLLPSSDHDVYLHGLDLCFPQLGTSSSQGAPRAYGILYSSLPHLQHGSAAALKIQSRNCPSLQAESAWGVLVLIQQALVVRNLCLHFQMESAAVVVSGVNNQSVTQRLQADFAALSEKMHVLVGWRTQKLASSL